MPHNFEGCSRAVKRDFCGQNFPKSDLKCFFGMFFQNFIYGAEILTKTIFLMLWESSENQFDRSKNDRQNFQKFFETPPPR